MKEVWRPIKGLEELEAEVSTEGNVRAREGVTASLCTRQKGKREGYIDAQFSENGRQFKRSLAHLVAAAFLPNPEGRMFVAPIDGNPSNCNVTNLCWMRGVRSGLTEADLAARVPPDLRDEPRRGFFARINDAVLRMNAWLTVTMWQIEREAAEATKPDIRPNIGTSEAEPKGMQALSDTIEELQEGFESVCQRVAEAAARDYNLQEYCARMDVPYPEHKEAEIVKANATAFALAVGVPVRTEGPRSRNYVYPARVWERAFQVTK